MATDQLGRDRLLGVREGGAAVEQMAEHLDLRRPGCAGDGRRRPAPAGRSPGAAGRSPAPAAPRSGTRPRRARRRWPERRRRCRPTGRSSAPDDAPAARRLRESAPARRRGRPRARSRRWRASSPDAGPAPAADQATVLQRRLAAIQLITSARARTRASSLPIALRSASQAKPCRARASRRPAGITDHGRPPNGSRLPKNTNWWPRMASAWVRSPGACQGKLRRTSAGTGPSRTNRR